MSVSINDKFLEGFITPAELNSIRPNVMFAYHELANKNGLGYEFTGWVDFPKKIKKSEITKIKKAAARIQKMCDVLIVIGIGGSYLGARAAIEFCKSTIYNSINGKTPYVYFAGNNLSAASVADLFEFCKNKDVCINVISKSGTTTESAISFRIFREYMEEKYGKEESIKRIFATTDKEKGTLKHFSDDIGYETFVIPDEIGGRYSVLTAVGLLPMAVAGIDIDKVLEGAKDSYSKYTTELFENNDCLKYAAYRNLLYRKGKNVEIMAAYEPGLQIFSEWWKQLFGESEGKDGKGIYPSSVIFSTDLHSLGQYIQCGLRNLFETVIDVKNSDVSIKVPNDPNNIDGLNFLTGTELNDINRTAMLATLFAHTDGGVPNILIEVNDRSPYTFGYLVYFFELACAVSGYMLGVNPFDQPGVEEYKKNMFGLLGKPGYEEIAKKINKRVEDKGYSL